MTTSICITVFNEESSVGRLLDSLLVQSKKPDEIVIVDAGSADRTPEIIRHYQKKSSKIKFLTEKGGIAHGRNMAIEIAKGDVIVQTDAGCTAKPDWLEKITAPFYHKNVDLAAGFYEMPAATPLQEAINVFHGIPPQRYDPETFIPSARSVAFRKKVWEAVGGYSEKLEGAGEDTLFFYEVVKNKFRIIRVGEARVVWEEAKNMSFQKSLKKFFNYAKGDAQSGIWWHPVKHLASHNIKILSIFLRYILGLFGVILFIAGALPFFVLAVLAVLYLIYPVYKWQDVVRTWKGRMFLPVIQISSDFAVMAGFASGVFGR